MAHFPTSPRFPHLLSCHWSCWKARTAGIAWAEVEPRLPWIMDRHQHQTQRVSESPWNTFGRKSDLVGDWWFDCFLTSSAEFDPSPGVSQKHSGTGDDWSCQAWDPFSFDAGSRRQCRSTASTAWCAGHGLQGCEIIQSHDTVWCIGVSYNVLQYDHQYIYI